MEKIRIDETTEIDAAMKPIYDDLLACKIFR